MFLLDSPVSPHKMGPLYAFERPPAGTAIPRHGVIRYGTHATSAGVRQPPAFFYRHTDERIRIFHTSGEDEKIDERDTAISLCRTPDTSRSHAPFGRAARFACCDLRYGARRGHILPARRVTCEQQWKCYSCASHGCLDSGARRRTWPAAISLGEPLGRRYQPGMSEWGNPPAVMGRCSVPLWYGAVTL